MLALFLILIALSAFMLTVKTCVELWRTQISKPLASPYQKPILLKTLQQNYVEDEAISLCDLTQPSPCPPGLTCRQSLQDIPMSDSQGHVITLPANTDLRTGYCLPSEDRECNVHTSQKILSKLHHKYVYLCHCKYPHLVTKRSLLEDCNEIVACGKNGHLWLGDVPGKINVDPKLFGRCRCPPEQEAAHSPDVGPYCRQRTVTEKYEPLVRTVTEKYEPLVRTVTEKYEPLVPCPDGYSSVNRQTPHVHHQFKSFLPATETLCVKNPCSWNAFSPKEFLPLSRQKENECECHPTESFKIHSDQSILTGHYNACGKYRNVLQQSSNVSYNCCFYEKDEQPHCYWEYDGYVQPVIFFGRSTRRIKIADPWNEKYNFFHRVVTSKFRAAHHSVSETNFWQAIGTRIQTQRTEREILPCNAANDSSVSMLCQYYNAADKTYHGRVILDPAYVKMYGKSCFKITNASDMLTNSDVVPEIVAFQKAVSRPAIFFPLPPST